MNIVKIPTAILDVLREAEACNSLARQYGAGWFPSPRSLVYAAKGAKLTAFAKKAMADACPATAEGEWEFGVDSGLATKVLPPKVTKPKKPRAKPVATPVAPAATVPEAKPTVVPVKPAVSPKVSK